MHVNRAGKPENQSGDLEISRGKAISLRSKAYLSNTPTNLCIALCCILLYRVVLSCNVLLIYCYVDIIQYNAVHKFVGVLDNPRPKPGKKPWERGCLRSEEFKNITITGHIGFVFEKKTGSEKSRDNRDVIVFKMFSVHTKTKSRFFQIPPFEERLR